MSDDPEAPAAQALPDDAEAVGPASPATCAVCGALAADGVPLTWTVQQSERGRGLEHVCDACARAYIRGIEGRLAPEWW